MIANEAVLNNGVRLPWVAFGLYNINGEENVRRAVERGLEAGFRSFDGATLYGNESSVGAALKASGIPREQIVLTSKVWNSEQGYEGTLAAFERSRKRLGLDYLDLYLIHWPVPGQRLDSWRALEHLYETGLVKAIGVSNFEPHHLDELLAHCRVPPAVDQVELHPYLSREDLSRYGASKGILIEAWSPLMHGKVLADPVLTELAAKYGRSPAQIILRWLRQRGIVAIPKAANPGHIRDNFQASDFELAPEDLGRIAALNRSRRIGPDPDTVDYSSDDEFLRIFHGWEEPADAVAAAV